MEFVVKKISKSEDLIVWGRNGAQALLAARCGECGGTGNFFNKSTLHIVCEHCSGNGWFGIDPWLPVQVQPGSVEKLAMLTARYAAGAPLWNRHDGLPSDSERRGETVQTQTASAPAVFAEAGRSPASTRRSRSGSTVSSRLRPGKLTAT